MMKGNKMYRLVFLSLLLMTSSLCLSAPPIYLGLDADLSAVAKEGGIAIKRGALIAIEEINANGGVLGRPLSLIVKDHRGNPARGIANIKAFSQQEGLVAVLGGVHTPVAMKELPVIHENQMIYLDPWRQERLSLIMALNQILLFVFQYVMRRLERF